MPNIRTGLSILIGLGTVFVASVAANAAAYPDRPVHIIVGFAPGGGADVVARLLAKKFSEKWGQPAIVENRAGADGNIADDYIAHAAPDGYTLLLATTNHTIPPEGYTQNYDPIKSFAPIGMVGFTPDLLLVNNSVPVNSARELIAFAKAHPGQLNFGADGTGTPVFMHMALFMDAAGIRMTNVTYKGGGAALIGLLGNEVQVLFGSVGAARPQVAAGKLKALAVSTDSRSPIMPDVPTIAEATDLKNYNQSSYAAMLAPAGTPAAIIAKLHDDMVAAAWSPDVQAVLSGKLGFITATDTPDQLQDYLVKDVAMWKSVIQKIQRK